MESFNNMQEIWKQQHTPKPTIPSAELMATAQKNSKKIKHKHVSTLLILTITVLVLVAYFLQFNNGKMNRFAIGLFCMIGSLFLRILIEYISFRKFQQIDVGHSFSLYTAKLTSFYNIRKKIHFVITPILYALYCVGFALLLPIFKDNFSFGFYIYLLFSGTGFLVVFAWIIFKQNKKEMALLAFLKNDIDTHKAE